MASVPNKILIGAISIFQYIQLYSVHVHGYTPAFGPMGSTQYSVCEISTFQYIQQYIQSVHKNTVAGGATAVYTEISIDTLWGYYQEKIHC